MRNCSFKLDACLTRVITKFNVTHGYKHMAIHDYQIHYISNDMSSRPCLILKHPDYIRECSYMQ